MPIDIDIVGNPGSGKTTKALQMIETFSAKGLSVFLDDGELSPYTGIYIKGELVSKFCANHPPPDVHIKCMHSIKGHRPLATVYRLFGGTQHGTP